ncbi:arginine--tRNA ligase [Buchnera aphidicola (Neophyllaphis podocarpi)]|uniref:arginine--tRNA ligase n=1 Tax=Buchnera aphidicola TaxID=9 RepID=UPI0031B89BC4
MNLYKKISKEIKKSLIKNKYLIKDYNLNISNKIKKNIGHYQINGIIKIAKNIGKNPIHFAEKIISNMNIQNISDKIIIQKPGFINIFIKKSFLIQEIKKSIKSFRMNIKETKNKKKIILDYSSPNIAKEMHVGHLRSTIIGDAMFRIIKFIGHKAIKTNHIGDWGSQFGMIIAYIKETKNNKEIQKISLNKLNQIYSQAKKKYDSDDKFMKKSNKYLAKLQSNNKKCIFLWNKIKKITIEENNKIYKKLNVTLNNNDLMGESSYKNILNEVIIDLEKQKILKSKNGKKIVYLKEFKNKKGNPMGITIQRQDGAFLYSAIDIACIKYRCQILKANRILYYVDSRQNQHLKQVWMISKKAGYINENCLLEHHMFGMILNKEKKPFKTREGNTIKLTKLIKESIKKAKKIVEVNNKNISEIKKNRAAKIIGIGSLKYFDLSKNRKTDYVFSWNKMLNLNGNTAPYIQYSYLRILSIFQKAKVKKSILNGMIEINNENEMLLALKLIQFEETIQQVIKKGTPHILCKYIYDLSTIFSNFYEKYSIISSDNNKIKHSRINLIFITAKTIKKGLMLLGIKTTKYM